jgi:hypothetical protein
MFQKIMLEKTIYCDRCNDPVFLPSDSKVKMCTMCRIDLIEQDNIHLFQRINAVERSQVVPRRRWKQMARWLKRTFNEFWR